MRKSITNLVIHAEPFAGAHIDECRRDAAEMALQHDLPVTFLHNKDRYCVDPVDLLKQCHKEKEQK